MNKKQTTALTVLSPGGDYAAYTAKVMSFPLLTKKEEKDLAVKFKEEGDLDAARELVMSHLRLVVNIVSKNYWWMESFSPDLVQEGNIGLMEAVKAFDPERGFRLTSYAMPWIRSKIGDFLRKNTFMVGNSRYRDMDKKMPDIPFDDEDQEKAPQDFTIDHDSDPAAKVLAERTRKDLVAPFLAVLNDREKRIVETRWLADEKRTLKLLSYDLGVSLERVRQLELKAFDKMRLAAADMDLAA